MNRIVFFILVFVAALFFAPNTANAQTFKFECLCTDAVTGDTCDVCTPSSNIAGRSFSGLMIYRYNTGTTNYDPYKWIDAPYSIRQKPGQSLEFLEYGTTNPDRITISRTQTEFYTYAGFIDSTWCECNNNRVLFYASDSTDFAPIYTGDTLLITGWGATTVTFDSILKKYVIYTPVSGGGGGSGTVTNFSFTDANGFDGTVTNPTTTPNLTLATTVTGIIYGATGSLNPVTVGSGLTFSAPTLSAVDVSAINEGIIGVAAGGATSAQLTSNTSGASNVTINVAGILSITEFTASNGGAITLTGTEVDGDATNEAQTLSVSGTSTGIISLNAISGVGGGTATIAGGGINTVSQLSGTITVTGTEVDGALANEGVLGVGAGGASSSVVTSNTAGATGVTINASTGLSISESTSSNGGSITLTNTSPLGTGTVNYFTKWATSSTLSNTSLMYEDGNEVGVNTTTPFAEFHLNNGDFGAYKNTTGSNGASLFLGDLNYDNASFFDKAPGLTAVYNSSQGVASDLGFYSYNGSRNLRAILDKEGNFGVGTATPARLLHVAGTARITGSVGTATTITGRDGSGDISNVTVGSGLSLSGGTLSATAANAWINGGNTFGAATPSIGNNDNFPLLFETNALERARISANGEFMIGTFAVQGKLTTSGIASTVGIMADGGTGLASGTTLIKSIGTFTSGFGYVFDGNATLSGGNIFGRVRNSSNTASSQAIHNISVAGSTAGDPFTQYQVEGANTWAVGIDNSVAADPFKIARTSALGVSTSDDVFIIETDGRASIGGTPTIATTNLTVAGTGGVRIPAGNSAGRPASTESIIRHNTQHDGMEAQSSDGGWHLVTARTSPTVTIGNAMGTGGTVGATVNGSYTNGSITIQTGTTGLVNNGTIVTVNYPVTFSANPTMILDGANPATMNERTKFYVSNNGQASSIITANGTLTANTNYVLWYIIKN